MRTAVDLNNLSLSAPLDGDILKHKDFGYRLYDSIEKKVIRSRDVVYLEDQTIESIDKDDKSRFSDDILASSDSKPIRILPTLPPPQDEPRRSTSKRRLSNKYNPNEYVLLTDGGESESYSEVVLEIAASLNLEIEEFDVKTTFLHGDLEEEIYMEQSEEFKESGKENLIDDMLIVGRDAMKIEVLKRELNHFKISIKQCPTSEKDKENMRNISYASAVGSLMYAMIFTRPDIAHAVKVVRQYLSNPGKEH
nr:uncharacterized protein LOC113722763 [Coffea arabica]